MQHSSSSICCAPLILINYLSNSIHFSLTQNVRDENEQIMTGSELSYLLGFSSGHLEIIRNMNKVKTNYDFEG